MSQPITKDYCKCGKPIFNPEPPENYEGQVCSCDPKQPVAYEFPPVEVLSED